MAPHPQTNPGSLEAVPGSASVRPCDLLSDLRWRGGRIGSTVTNVQRAGTVAVVGLCLSVIGVLGLSSVASAKSSSPCAGAPADPEPPDSTPTKIKFDPVATGADHIQFDFGRSRGADDDVFFLNADGPLPAKHTALETVTGKFRRVGEGGRIRSEQVRTRAVVLDRDTVQVFVCVDPKGAGEGRYEGVVGFADARVAAEPVRVVANLQYTGWLSVLLLAVAGWLAAVAVTYFALAGALAPLAWMKQPRTQFALAAGFVAAVLLYWSEYINNQAWRFDADALGLITKMYGGAIAAMAAILGAATLARGRAMPDLTTTTTKSNSTTKATKTTKKKA
jgi:hypothetical protein